MKKEDVEDILLQVLKEADETRIYLESLRRIPWQKLYEPMTL